MSHYPSAAMPAIEYDRNCDQLLLLFTTNKQHESRTSKLYRRLECTTIATLTRRRILLVSGRRMPSVRLLVPFTHQHIYRASYAARMPHIQVRAHLRLTKRA
jgi:hypothetical protein